jgi:anti-sigma factor RsiW
MKHLTTELIASLDDTLAPGERAEVEAHLASCADCRRERDDFVAMLVDLRGSLPAAPEPHWGRWRAELRARLEARPARPRRLRPLPMALSAALAAGLVAVVWISGERQSPRSELGAMEEVAVGGRLELVREYPLLERLDLLEDLEVIDQLDRLAARGEG